MKRVAIGLACMVASGSVLAGAKCQGLDGMWHDYGSPECDSGSINEYRRDASVEDENQAKIRSRLNIVRSSLKDPDSARFSTILTSGDLLCGYVNAKNSYGGYTGDKPFLLVIIGGRTHVLVDKDVYGSQLESNGTWIDSSTYAKICFSGKLVQ